MSLAIHQPDLQIDLSSTKSRQKLAQLTTRLFDHWGLSTAARRT